MTISLVSIFCAVNKYLIVPMFQSVTCSVDLIILQNIHWPTGIDTLQATQPNPIDNVYKIVICDLLCVCLVQLKLFGLCLWFRSTDFRQRSIIELNNWLNLIDSFPG